jgi:hypothetical protein
MESGLPLGHGSHTVAVILCASHAEYARKDGALVGTFLEYGHGRIPKSRGGGSYVKNGGHRCDVLRCQGPAAGRAVVLATWKQGADDVARVRG